jgi:peptide-methionine (S)-S-oxide reductase
MNIFRKAPAPVPNPEDCLPGRSEPIQISGKHFVSGTSMFPPFPDGMDTLIVGMGCFWGAERLFWQAPGVYTTAAGYSGGTTPNPTYRETCTSMTGHTEAVLVVFDPKKVDLDALFKVFWENHDPTQYMGQGNDIGSQYRTAVYWNSEEQRDAAVSSFDRYQEKLTATGHGKITTEIAEAGEFYYAEEEHQQYLAKNPWGYCNHGFCQVEY